MCAESMTTVLTLLETQVARRPDDPALTFLHTGETPAGCLTFRQLQLRAKKIAVRLLESGVAPGARVLLVYPEGLEFLPALLGCLYAGVVAVPTPAPDALRSKRALPHMQAVYSDAQACRLLTIEELREQLPNISSFPVLTTDCPSAFDGISSTHLDQIVFPGIDISQLAYLQYTSGSTGSPKGVMITHRCVLANVASMNAAFPYTEESICLTWMPHTHDFGLVYGLLRPLLAGVPNYIMSPGAYLRRPMRWLKAISRFRVTQSGGATFAYRQCLQYVGSEECAGLDLSSWLVAPMGAEPIPAAMLEEFTSGFAPYGFAHETLCPAYGLAEATLMVTTKGQGLPWITGSFPEEGHLRRLTGCGCCWGDTEIKIVDPVTHAIVPEGEVGEVWVRGASVGEGYWHRPTETEETFGNLVEGVSYLRTGDLGLVSEKTLFITGRIKDLVILNGQNYYPSDIEWCIDESHPILKNGMRAAFAVDTVDGDVDGSVGSDRLVVVCEVDPKVAKTTDLESVVLALREAVVRDFALSVYGVVLVRRGTLPKTPSGKVQRRACRAAWMSGELESLYTWRLGDKRVSDSRMTEETKGSVTPTEEKLVEIWRTLLGTEAIATHDNFFVLGGHSVLAVSMMGQVEQHFQYKLTMKSFLLNPTIAHLAAQLDALQAMAPNNSGENDGVKDGVKGVAVPSTVSAEERLEIPTLSAEQNSALDALYNGLGQQEILKEVDEWHLPAEFTARLARLAKGVPQLQSRLDRFIRQLPGSVAIPVLRQLVRHPRIQGRYWSALASLSRDFHGVLDTPVAVTTMVENSLFNCLAVCYGLHLREMGVSNPFTPQLVGEALLEEVSRAGRGMIVVRNHSYAHLARVLENSKSYKPGVQIVGVEINTRKRGLPLDVCTPILFSRYLELAVEALARGEAVSIFPDGFYGSGTPREILFHGRIFHFYTGFADLALLTGATVVPVMAEMRPGERPILRVMPPLDPGADTMPYRARVEQLCGQYERLLYENWRTMPWGVPWEGMRHHLHRPRPK